MRTNEFPIRQAIGLVVMPSVLLLGLLVVVSGIAEADSESDSTAPGTLEFVGRNTFATANGIFRAWKIVSSAVDPMALSESFAIVEVDLASVDTGSDRRDAHLRDPDFFEVEAYPVAKVRVHSARPNGNTEAGQPRFSAQFDIDLHGVERTIEGEVVLASEEPLVFEGNLAVDRTDFGVGSPPSRWNPMSVKAEIPIRFRVEL
jgi:polyisoprenoid-binding protein YceI